jgi:hypothetical protein
VLDAAERGEALADRVERHPAGERDGGGGHRVLAVVGAAEPDLVVGDQARSVPPQRAVLVP